MSLTNSDIAAVAALLQQPAMEPPEGVTPDFTNPPNDNDLACFVITFTLVVSTLCVLLRAFDKCYLSRQYRVEDLLILGAYACFIGQAYAAYALLSAPGYMIHQWNLHYIDVVEAAYLFLLFGDFYSLILPALKVAILIEWCRIFVVAGTRYRSPFWWACVAIGTLQTIWGAVCVLLLNLQCIPHAKIWAFYLPGTCISLHQIQLASASIQVVSDLAMTVLPHRLIWNLHMGWRKKLGVSLIFGCGLLACLAAVVRLYATVRFGLAVDQMFYFGPVAFWCITEGTCGFLIVCVPCMPKIIKETRFGRRIRAALGIRRTTNNVSLSNTAHSRSWGPGKTMGTTTSGGGAKSTSGSSSRWGTTAEAYYEIEEDAHGVALDNVRRSLSNKKNSSSDGAVAMRDLAGSPEAIGVIVTTEMSVTVTTAKDGSSSTSMRSGESGLGEVKMPPE